MKTIEAKYAGATGTVEVLQVPDRAYANPSPHMRDGRDHSDYTAAHADPEMRT